MCVKALSYLLSPYDSYALRDFAKQASTDISSNRSRKAASRTAHWVYRQRHLIERFF